MNFTYNFYQKDRFLGLPGLPQGRVSLLLMSPEAPELCSAMRKLGIHVITTHPGNQLPQPVQFHPDMLTCYLGNGRVVMPESENALQIKSQYFGVQTIFSRHFLGKVYPKDAGCNVLSIGNHVFYNPRSADPEILQQCFYQQQHKVAQGYTRCSVAVVNVNSVMTSDRGLSQVMRQAGFQVLELEPGHIQLPGYEYGFIGGCCGLIAPNVLAFTGSLNTHPDGDRIKQFLQNQKVEFIELSAKPLRDIGGLIPLKEWMESPKDLERSCGEGLTAAPKKK